MNTNCVNGFPHPFDNAQLREVERLSPATVLNLVVGCDDEGWPIWSIAQVGVTLHSRHSGLIWRVAGFTLDDLIILVPHGLGHDSATKSMMIEGASLSHFDRVDDYADEVWRHKDGLVSFG